MGRLLGTASILLLLACITSAAPAPTAGDLGGLAPGHWHEVPNSKLRAAAATLPRAGDIRGIFRNWSGAAYDVKRDRLVIWGGGHAGYGGNELYAFDVAALRWERLTEPSSLEGWTDGDMTMPDGNPVAVHTYDGLEYLPNVDKLFALGSFKFRYISRPGFAWLFDFDAKKWIQISAEPRQGFATAWDPKTGNVYTHTQSAFFEYDPRQNSWRIVNPKTPIFWRVTIVAAIEPVRRKFVAIGGGETLVYDLDRPTVQLQRVPTSGDTEILSQTGPGLVYDPASQKLVAWSGGPSVFTLDMDAMRWTRVPPAATNTVTPTPPQKNGTYGRFSYVPSKNLFIAVNSVDENVYFYRLPASRDAPSPAGGAGASAPREVTRAGTRIDVSWKAPRVPHP
jgi:hypothetical protein